MQPVFWNLVRAAPDQRDVAAVESGRQKMIGIMTAADRQLAARPYLAGSAFSVGDMPLALVAYRWYNVPVERPSCPNVEAWFARIAQRPAFKAHCMLPLT
jgi:glutathione S-transferase